MVSRIEKKKKNTEKNISEKLSYVKYDAIKIEVSFICYVPKFGLIA